MFWVFFHQRSGLVVRRLVNFHLTADKRKGRWALSAAVQRVTQLPAAGEHASDLSRYEDGSSWKEPWWLHLYTHHYTWLKMIQFKKHWIIMNVNGNRMKMKGLTEGRCKKDKNNTGIISWIDNIPCVWVLCLMSAMKQKVHLSKVMLVTHIHRCPGNHTL